MTLTDNLSCTDNTITNFQDDEEKEKAKTIQSFLQPAITNFTASVNLSASFSTLCQHITGQIKLQSHLKFKGKPKAVTMANIVTDSINSKIPKPIVEGIILPYKHPAAEKLRTIVV